MRFALSGTEEGLTLKISQPGMRRLHLLRGLLVIEAGLAGREEGWFYG